MLKSHPSGSIAALRLLPVLFFFPGASSLVFETIFTRLLTYTFGNTAHAVSSVLAVFLGGLALGAHFIGRWVDRRGASLLTYGMLELLAGLVSMNLGALWQYEATGVVVAELLRFLCAFYLLILPCLLLGISFPLLLNLATEAGGVGSSVGGVYAANTLGTVLGSALTGFLVLAALGSHATLQAAATLNLALGLGVAVVLVPLSRARWSLAWAPATPCG